MKLTSENVNTVFKTCLSDEDGTLVKGVCMAAYIDRDHLDEQRPNIVSMASQLPDEFFDGGWTFLNMCIRKDQVQWTGEHEVCDKLPDPREGRRHRHPGTPGVHTPDARRNALLLIQKRESMNKSKISLDKETMTALIKIADIMCEATDSRIDGIANLTSAYLAYFALSTYNDEEIEPELTIKTIADNALKIYKAIKNQD